jgi:aryl-alcohol dehydrogenase-like predicted oxidoreductase
MLNGFATAEGTARYRDRFPQQAQHHHFRQLPPASGGLWLSSVGLGTYLGQPDQAGDAAYVAAITAALRSGINVLDTAINYRHQRSERNIGAALRQLVSAGELHRDEVVVCTKAGYLPFDGGEPEDPRQYILREYLDTGIAKREEIIGGNCMTPSYLAHQLERSRKNLGLETIDVFYVHNPETQFAKFERAEFRRRLGEVFTMLEQAAGSGKIRFYGMATWSGLRMDSAQPHYLSLFDAVEIAAEVGGDDHHFRFVQLPFNLALPEAFALPNQVFARKKVSVLEAAARLGITVIGSATLDQGRLAFGLSEELHELLDAETDAETAIQFSRSAPGLTTALVGMASEQHVQENLKVALRDPVAPEVWRRIFKAE